MRGHDIRAARIILEGLRVHGWSYDQLSRCQGAFMAEVFKYVNREQLSYGRIRCCSQAPRKRRHAEDDSIEHRRLRPINIDVGAL